MRWNPGAPRASVGLITTGREERKRANLEAIYNDDAFDVAVSGDPAGG